MKVSVMRNHSLFSLIFIFLTTLFFGEVVGQDITLSPLTTNVAPSPLASNATDVAILGVQFDKATGGTNSITALTIALSQNPVGRFTNPRLVLSDNGISFDAPDLANVVGTAAFGATSINITGGITTFSGNSGVETRMFFVVVDIDNSVTSATAPVTPSMTNSNVTAAGTVNPGIVTGIAYSFADTTPPIITFNPTDGSSGFPLASNITITFSEPIRNIDDSPITAGDLATLVQLKVTNNAGAIVPFTPSINGSNTIITIDPTSNLASNTVYFVEINPVEDASNNAIVTTSITFTSQDIDPPTVAFNPTDGSIGVLETTTITISFNEPIRKLDNSPITSGDLATLVELKLTDNSGASVPFNAVIDGSNTVITVTPSSVLAGNTTYYVEINPVEDASNNAIVATNIGFTTGDTLPPAITFNPTGGATNVSAVGNITITFSEPIRKLDDSPVTVSDIEGGLLELKVTDNGGADVPFTASINGTNTIITINPNTALLPNQIYYIEVNPIEDAVNNASSAQNITFTTEDSPNITGFLPAAGTCIGDNVRIQGTRFVGTGNPSSGNTEPTVTLNGVTISPVNISAFTSTLIIFRLPVGATSGVITVRNNDSDLLSNTSASFTVFPAIDVTLPVTPATLSPAQNTSVAVQIIGTQDSNYNYALILNSGPGGYAATTQNTNGNNGNRTLTTTPNFSVVGNYNYRIEVSRTNCATKTLSNTPFTLSVASLAVTVSATTTNICLGSSTTLIGAVSGGTGFYQFRWTSNPPGYFNSSSSPTESPTSNIRYILEVEDNAGNIVTAFKDIVVNPVPTASFIPDPGNPPLIPAETSVRVNYVIENKDYLVSGSPAGGVFTGQGIVKKGDGKYYFNPLNATLGDWTIVYTYTDGNNCQGTDSRIFKVQSLVVNGVNQLYCKNVITQSGINVNIANAIRPGYQFTRLRFYAFYNGVYYYDLPLLTPAVGTPLAPGMPPGATYPLTLNSRSGSPVNDIQSPGAPINLPLNYTLNLDHVRNGWGFGTYYLDVFAKDASGNEVLQSWAFFSVVDNNPAPNIVGINETQNICADATPITLSSSELGYTVTGFTMDSVAFAGSLSGTNNRDFNPTHASFIGADERPLGVTMAYNDFNGCPSSVNRNFRWIKKPSAPFSADVEFCQIFGSARSFTIPASQNGPADKALWYEQDPTLNPSTPVIDSINFRLIAPGVTGLVPLNKTFYVIQNYRGCKGAVTPVAIEIKPAPNAIFTNTNICEDRDFTLTGPLDVTVPYLLYIWTLDTNNVDSIYNNNVKVFNYGPNSANSSKNIKLKVVNSVGCTNDFDKITTIGPNPKPSFTTNFICDGDNTVFNATTDIPVAEFSWDFGDGDIINRGPFENPVPGGGTIKNPEHKFAGTGNYPVTVTSFTASGCNNPFTKQVTILEYLTYNSSSPYSMASLDEGKGFWKLEDVNGNSTWAFALPTSTIKNKIASAAWVTNPAGFYSPNEKSFLNSPCLDIKDIQRPVLSMDMVLNTQENFDGVALEHSDDNGITWSATGNVNSGINWFNTSGFFAGNIGSSPVGWSGDSKNLEDNPDQDTLVRVRRALDNIPNLTLTERAKVRFRIAFQTNGDRELEGIAFNNLTIDSRNRISLVENFTNEADAGYTSNNNAFKNIAGAETAKIQYHMGFPGTDALYRANQMDPSARAAYYGLALTDQLIPRGYIDGFSNGRFDQTNWINSRFNKQALKNAPFTLTVTTQVPTDPSTIQISVSITADVAISAKSKPVLQIAVVEKTVGTNEFVLRKLVPSAAGTQLAVPMAQGDVINVNENIRIENATDVTKLALVVFIQDETTREVYQAGFDLNPANLPNPSVITGIETIAEYIQLYPNPANDSFVIELPTKTQTRLQVNLVDQVGRPVQEVYFEVGEQSKTVDTHQLAGGIYVVQIGAGKFGVVRKKIMIVHQN